MTTETEGPKRAKTTKQTNPEAPSSEITTGTKQSGSPKAAQHDERTMPWEHPLEDDEYPRLQELGLGVAVDITEKCPWEKKSAFQAKPVTQATDLIVINESNQFKKYSETVSSYSEVQTALESSFHPSPNQPIDVTIAADFHRGLSSKKSMKSEIVLTRTIAFRVQDPVSKADNKEKFEEQLNAWLEQQGCLKQSSGREVIPESCKVPGYHSRKEKSSTLHESEEESFWYYTQQTNDMCVKYIRALGGVTHYVSSITLGATRYQVDAERSLSISGSQSTGVRAERFASSTVKSQASRRRIVSTSKTEAIGRIPPSDANGYRYILHFRTVHEAVVRCSYTSLSNLVTHPKLQRELHNAIQLYIEFQVRGTRGPYYIATAVELPTGYQDTHTVHVEEEKPYLVEETWEPVGEEGLPTQTATEEQTTAVEAGKDQEITRDDRFQFQRACRTKPDGEKELPRETKPQIVKKSSRVYLRAEVGIRHDEYNITCTTDRDKATNFFMKPFEGKYFVVFADPKDPRITNRHPPSRESRPTIQCVIQDEEPFCPPTTNAYSRAPLHYIRATSSSQDRRPAASNNQLVANIVIDRKYSAFRLVSPHDRKSSVHLATSQWLPNSRLGSQPHHISLRGSVFQRNRSVYVAQDESKELEGLRYKLICERPSKSVLQCNQLFVLENGHLT